MSTKEVHDFFETWIFEKITMFQKENDLEDDWERVDEHPDFHNFMIKHISDEKVPVYIMNYIGQESIHPWNVYIDNKCGEWDSWIIKFFPSRKKARQFCRNKNLNLKLKSIGEKQ